MIRHYKRDVQNEILSRHTHAHTYILKTKMRKLIDITSMERRPIAAQLSLFLSVDNLQLMLINTRTLSQGIKPLKIKTFEKQRRLTVQNGLKTAVSFTRSLRSVSHCGRHKQQASGRVTHLFRHFAAYKPDPEVKHGKVKLLDQLPAANFRFRFLEKKFNSRNHAKI